MGGLANALHANNIDNKEVGATRFPLKIVFNREERRKQMRGIELNLIIK